MKNKADNLLVLQSGGPTPVFNTTLAAVIDEARRHASMGRVLGAQSGMHGLCRGNFLDLTDLSTQQLAQLRNTPGAALGTSRFVPSADELDQALDHLTRQRISRVILIGGNGSMRGGEALCSAARAAGLEIAVIAAPKTIDNDIPGTDRCPGYGSAARYVAQSIRDLAVDVRSLPQPVSIYETMGRSVGWLAAASVLAKRDPNDAPHLVYLPERPFSVEAFIADVDRVVKQNGWAIVVVSEGLRKSDGQFVYQTTNRSQLDDCGRPVPGNVAAYLAEAVTQQLKIRCRSEKPGLCARASMLHVSQQDRADAEAVGRAAVVAAMEGHTGLMIALRPLKDDATSCCESIPLSAVAGQERVVPPKWLCDGDIPVDDRFIRYARRMVGPLNEFLRPLAEMTPPAVPQQQGEVLTGVTSR